MRRVMRRVPQEEWISRAIRTPCAIAPKSSWQNPRRRIDPNREEVKIL